MSTGLARRIGLFDATMLGMGGVIGSGIFVNPYVVAQEVGTPFLILCALTLMSLVIGPFAAAATLRQGLD